MFKIPSYDEIENKEKQQNYENNRNSYQNSLFQKRKHSSNDDEQLKTKHIATENKFQENTDKDYGVKHIQSARNVGHNDDDDDELLNAFIAENKDNVNLLISKPIKSISMESENLSALHKEKNSSNQSTSSVFKKPEPIKATSVNQVTSSGAIIGGGSAGGGPLVVNSKQRGNPVLKHIRNVQWKYSDHLVPDYCMTRNSCALYLTMKYHLLNPTYIHNRLKELGNAYDLRVLLVLVDVKEPQHCIKELEKISIFANLTMILCWSSEEVGRYLETYKAYEFKSSESIMEKSTNQLTFSNNPSTNIGINSNNSHTNFINNYTDFLCQIKSINKTDASTLRQTFGSIKQLSQTNQEELNLCPGLGPLKVKRILEIFKTSFQLPKKSVHEKV